MAWSVRGAQIYRAIHGAVILILAAAFACALQCTAPVDAARADDLPRPLRKGLERIGVSGDALCALTVCVGVLAEFAGFDSLPCHGECLVTPDLSLVSLYAQAVLAAHASGKKEQAFLSFLNGRQERRKARNPVHTFRAHVSTSNCRGPHLRACSSMTPDKLACPCVGEGADRHSLSLLASSQD
jgi:hypothetical protein